MRHVYLTHMFVHSELEVTNCDLQFILYLMIRLVSDPFSWWLFLLLGNQLVEVTENQFNVLILILDLFLYFFNLQF